MNRTVTAAVIMTAPLVWLFDMRAPGYEEAPAGHRSSTLQFTTLKPALAFQYDSKVVESANALAYASDVTEY